jgi:hypothetical protein
VVNESIHQSKPRPESHTLLCDNIFLIDMSCVSKRIMTNRHLKIFPGLLVYNFLKFPYEKRSRDSVGITATGYGLYDKRSRSSSPGRKKNFLVSTSSRSVLKPAQPSFQWVLGALSLGVKRPGVKLTTHPN